MASGLDTITKMFSAEALKSGAMDIAQYIIWGSLILGVALFSWLKWQDKKMFTYPVRIFRQRRNGQVKEQNTFGGYKKVNKVSKFIIKVTKTKKKEMDKLPLSEWMDEDNRVYYWQVSPDAPLIQVKRDFIIESVLAPKENFVPLSKEEKDLAVAKILAELKQDEELVKLDEDVLKAKAEELHLQEVEIEKNRLIDVTKATYSPVPTDLKQQAMSEINEYRNTLGVDVNKQFTIFTIGVIALSILGLIIFYIAVNQGDIPILTK